MIQKKDSIDFFIVIFYQGNASPAALSLTQMHALKDLRLEKWLFVLLQGCEPGRHYQRLQKFGCSRRLSSLQLPPMRATAELANKGGGDKL